MISNQVLDGLEAVIHGSAWQRRVYNINYIRWADDFIVTANSREVLEEVILPRINAFLAERGVRLSPTKTLITPIEQGFDCLGQTIRKYPRPNGKPAKLQITPNKASLDAVKAKIKTLCKQAAGAPPEQLIDTLNPVLRGWANYHRHVICGKAFHQLDNYVWRRMYRGAKPRHPNKTGRWIAERYFPHRQGEAWRFTDPKTGKQLIRIQQTVKAQRHLKIKGEANPFDREWDDYFQRRDRQLAVPASTGFRATVLTRLCPLCRQVIQCEEDLEWHHRDHNHQNNHIGNLMLLHPNCHRQLHYAPDNKTESARPERGVGHA